MNAKTILEKAIATYGEDNQVFKACEELGELIVELSRNSQGEVNIMKIAGEVADVQIMCSQLELIFNIEAETKTQREFKLKRLYKRLKEHKYGKMYKHICDDKSCRLVEIQE